MTGPTEQTVAAGVKNLSVEEKAQAGADDTGAVTTEQTNATEQTIDPWSVSAGTDADGNQLQFDYKAISQYECPAFDFHVSFLTSSL